MHFIKGGPDIPERLLQLHEDGRVVFFCGAGISYPAGLRGFEWLAKGLYERLGVPPNLVQEAALRAGRFDTAIGLLEDPHGGHAGGRLAVRKELAAILAEYDTSPKATKTHEALLTLAKDRNGKLRLITTNFDRLFESVVAQRGMTLNRFSAPLLPVPKSRWNGLVYLHGLLADPPHESELDSLVVSSGDFGLAYLTERWAARFVSELFRNYTVCFVGYSLDDPVLRYMTDALAADRQRGESPVEMYAFGGYTKGKVGAREAEWRGKNVTPILYWETERHRYLHKTLHRWSEVYRDGVRGKEMIIAKEAGANPLTMTKEDVDRVLWALSHESGLPARRFAKLDPAPSLSWLIPFSEKRFGHADLERFGIPAKARHDDSLHFSLVSRPMPYDLAPWMELCDAGDNSTRCDDVMVALENWLLRHLDEPDLVLWLAKRGGQLHPSFVRRIDKELDRLAQLEHDGQHGELDDARTDSPRGITGPVLRTFWRLLLSGRIRSGSQGWELFTWWDRFKRDGLTPSLRLALRELLTPCIQLREPFRRSEDAGEGENPLRLKEVIDWELRLCADRVHHVLRRGQESPEWQLALPELLPDLSLLLRDVLDLMRELGGADSYSDHSYVYQPSISKHPQNQDFHDWTALIDLVRDAWLVQAQRSEEQARLVAQQWWQVPYPLFKRLAFFTAAQGPTIPSQMALDWLLADDCRWLWLIETQREALQLLVALSPQLKEKALERVEAAILAGPPRAMYGNDLTQEQWARIVAEDKWLRLAKMEAAGATLGKEAQTALRVLSATHPELQLEEHEEDWMGTGDESRQFVVTPRRRRDLVAWLKDHPDSKHWQEDDWRQRCRDNFSTTACALYALACGDVWPVARWREALQAWGEERLLKRSWRYMAPVLARMPTEVTRKIAYALSWWLEKLAKIFEGHRELFFQLCQRVLILDHAEMLETDEPYEQAIIDRVGHVTEALLHWWFRRELADNQCLPAELSPVFTRLCDLRIPGYKHARVLLASRAIVLFRVDPDWAKRYLLPLFNWQASPGEAKAAWAGFLWAPRIYSPLLERIRADFLETAKHYSELGPHGRQYAALLTFIALEQRDTFTTAEIRSATEALPLDGRREAVRALAEALESAGEQRLEYWRNRVMHYWKHIWPQSLAFSQGLSGELAWLCIAANEAFPEAVEGLTYWLQPVENDRPVRQLNDEGLTKCFPEAALVFLDKVVGTNVWVPKVLAKCLDNIKAENPSLEQDPRFRRLDDLRRRFDG